ncbi:hypothetical protein M569_17630 [Genlisea aurea]|uniref:Uncharacterized protein n=1 Tax=Genlisea aurea TaxID=192259 RepID=S8BYD1_9LAMI|nr:hypothetical protein M569_17630 [Genlisea aurea]
MVEDDVRIEIPCSAIDHKGGAESDEGRGEDYFPRTEANSLLSLASINYAANLFGRDVRKLV